MEPTTQTKPGINLGNALGGLAGLASNILGAWTNNRNVDKTNKANRELAEYSYSKDLEMWNRQNEYNLPASQMARLREAGLNPNLVYGNGAGQSQAATMPKYNAPNLDYNYKPMVDPLQTLGAFQDFQVRNAQTNNLKAQNKILAEEGEIKRLTRLFLEDTFDWRKTKSDMDTRIRAIEYGWKGNDFSYNTPYGSPTEYQKYMMDALREGVNLKKAGITNLGARTRLTEAQEAFYDLNQWARILAAFGIKLPNFTWGRSAGKGGKATMRARPSSGSQRVIKNGNITTTTWQKN